MRGRAIKRIGKEQIEIAGTERGGGRKITQAKYERTRENSEEGFKGYLWGGLMREHDRNLWGGKRNTKKKREAPVFLQQGAR